VSKLHRLYDEQSQSPWLYNLTRPYLRDGTRTRFVDDGIRGVTANPTIFAKARASHVGLDMDDVSLTLEDQGVTGFHESFARVLDTLNTKTRQLARR
jgi:transaldolase